MTNWQTFRISEVQTWYKFDCVRIAIDDSVKFWDGHEKRVFCVNRYPFNTWYAGNHIEIDLDRLRYWNRMNDISDTGIVRKATVSTSLVTVSSQAELQQFIKRAQLTGEGFECKVEQADWWTGDYRSESVIYRPKR